MIGRRGCDGPAVVAVLVWHWSCILFGTIMIAVRQQRIILSVDARAGLAARRRLDWPDVGGAACGIDRCRRLS